MSSESSESIGSNNKTDSYCITVSSDSSDIRDTKALVSLLVWFQGQSVNSG